MTVVITGDEAHHASRVKRVEPGEVMQVLDGRGQVARAVVLPADAGGSNRRRGSELILRLLSISETPPTRPVVEVCSATPKGSRVDELIDGLSQVRAAAWRPLHTARGVVEPRESKLGRLERRALEASKQSGRAWVMEIGQEIGLPEALLGGTPFRIVIADASGQKYQSTGATAVRLLVGPEGGFEPEELKLAADAGATICSFGSHIMRIEMAAIAASAIVMDAESRG